MSLPPILPDSTSRRRSPILTGLLLLVIAIGIPLALGVMVYYAMQLPRSGFIEDVPSED